MIELTVKQLASTTGIPIERLLTQLSEAGINVSGPYTILTEREKLKFLEYLRRCHGNEDENGAALIRYAEDDYTEAKNWFSGFQCHVKESIGSKIGVQLIRRFAASFEADSASEYKYYNEDTMHFVQDEAANFIKDIESFGNYREIKNNEEIFLISLCYAFDYIHSQKRPRKKPFAFLDAISGLRNYIAELGGHSLKVWDRELEKTLNSFAAAKNTLYERRMQMLRKDAYGIVDPARWTTEKKEFAEKIVRISLGRKINDIVGYALSNVICFDILDELLDEHDKKIKASTENGDAYQKQNDWLDYEESCIESLIRNGWSASGTPRTGDKGADIIASKRGVGIVGQCKYWRGKINSSAIQEVVTAKLYFEAQFAVIFCENGCTAQAQEMADRMNVIVAREADIPELDIMLAKILLR